MSGRVRVVGLGPGDPRFLTPEAEEALAAASDLVGYGPYVDRLPHRPGQVRHASDNRQERGRAEHALALAAEGRRVALVSGGDPGVFAMAAALCEALEEGPATWRALDVAIFPGVTAMLAAAASVGAPLGHDFCAISLSDNLKPWDIVARRLDAAAGADFVLALYNPVSGSRPRQIADAFAILRRHRDPDTPVVFARAVGRADERVAVTSLGEADPTAADMSTLVIVGSSRTRRFAMADGRAMVYTPRFWRDMA